MRTCQANAREHVSKSVIQYLTRDGPNWGTSSPGATSEISKTERIPAMAAKSEFSARAFPGQTLEADLFEPKQV